MAFLADHQHRLHRLGRGVQAPAHLVGLGKGGQAGLQGGVVVLVAGKLHAHEEQACGVVVVLGCFFNIAAVFHQEPGHGVHQPQSVGAGQGKDVGLGHRRPIVAALAPVCCARPMVGAANGALLRCVTAIAGAVSRSGRALRARGAHTRSASAGTVRATAWAIASSAGAGVPSLGGGALCCMAITMRAVRSLGGALAPRCAQHMAGTGDQHRRLAILPLGLYQDLGHALVAGNLDARHGGHLGFASRRQCPWRMASRWRSRAGASRPGQRCHRAWRCGFACGAGCPSTGTPARTASMMAGA